MDAVDALHRCGGVADHATLRRLTTRRSLRRAVSDRTVVRVTKGRYALPTARDALVAAHRVRGVHLHWADLSEDDIREGVVTSRQRTERRSRTPQAA